MALPICSVDHHNAEDSLHIPRYAAPCPPQRTMTTAGAATATAARRPAQPRGHRRRRPAAVLRPRPGGPLEQIARQAGVGIATLYRHFPNRAALLDSVLTDNLQSHIDAAEQALATDDPWDGFAFYLEQSTGCRPPTAASTTSWACGSPAPPPPVAKTRLYEVVGQVLDRAQQSGQLRPDLTLEDLAFLNWANTRIIQAVRAAGTPFDAWRRHLGLLLDGFRADRANPCPSRR